MHLWGARTSSLSPATTSSASGAPGGWQRFEPLPRPDARFGFPWTVKDWDKRQRKAGIEDIEGDLFSVFFSLLKFQIGVS